MVGFGDELISIMDKLTGGHSNLEVIPITGMGGIGKTTLAYNVFNNPCIVQHFDIRAWVTISQDYNMPEIILSLLNEIGEMKPQGTERQLGDILYKSLYGRSYLIVMDDMWSIVVWDKLKTFVPINDNGCRVMVTTRLLEVAKCLPSSNPYMMNLLDDEKSWSLLCKTVFGQGDCPLEMEKTGKEIAKNCRGLPLSIVVIGGLLAKSKMIQEHWENVVKDVNEIVNTEGSGHYLEILSLSYSHLPIHLKPCFLYMGTLPEDHEIRISRLIKLWIAEGYLKPDGTKSLEEVARQYLKDLIDRNLISVRMWGSIGNMKTCGIHDLLRDLCLREAQQEGFLIRTGLQGISQKERRIVIGQDLVSVRHMNRHIPYPSPLASFTRSLVSHFVLEADQLDLFKLLRVLNMGFGWPYSTHSCKPFQEEVMYQLVNLRQFAVESSDLDKQVPSKLFLFWNIQILILYGPYINSAAFEIWKMPQLSHFYGEKCHLSDPCSNDFVLENLQTLKGIAEFRCSKEVLERIPSIKKLNLSYRWVGFDISHYCLNNLGYLHKLQSLYLSIPPGNDTAAKNVAFPESLKKLILVYCTFHWDDIMTKIGSLPHLEMLSLCHSAVGDEWNPVEGQFLRLKSFTISWCGLKTWTADSSHFPCLERLHLYRLKRLGEIPSGIGDIPTLRSILLDDCSDLAVASALQIVEEQQSFGNEDLQLTLHSSPATVIEEWKILT